MTTEEFVPYKFIKLSNGEDIVCTIENNDSSENQVKVLHPLKMQVLPRALTGGQGDSIGLSHWIQPMTEAISFQISLKDILLEYKKYSDEVISWRKRFFSHFDDKKFRSLLK